MHGGDGDERDGETGGQGMQDEEEDAAPPATMSRDEAVESVQARLSALAVRSYAEDVTAVSSSREAAAAAAAGEDGDGTEPPAQEAAFSLAEVRSIMT